MPDSRALEESLIPKTQEPLTVASTGYPAFLKGTTMATACILTFAFGALAAFLGVHNDKWFRVSMLLIGASLFGAMDY